MIPTHREQVSFKLKSKFSTRIRWPRLKSEHKHPTRPPKSIVRLQYLCVLFIIFIIDQYLILWLYCKGKLLTYPTDNMFFKRKTLKKYRSHIRFIKKINTIQNITTYNKTISFLQKKTIFHKRKNSRPDIPSLLLYELKNTFLYFAPFTNFLTVL